MIRILIVDDRNIVRQGVKAILEANPELEVVGTASDGENAIEQAAALQPDVMLVDIEMPKMDGITATQKICQQFPEIKVLVLSGHDNRDYLVQAVRAGADGYLLKNTLVKNENLVRAIWSIHQGHSQIEASLLKEVLAETVPPRRKGETENKSFNLTEKQLTSKVTLDSNNNLDRANNIRNSDLKDELPAQINATTPKPETEPPQTDNDTANNSNERSTPAKLPIFARSKDRQGKQSRNRWSIALVILGLLTAAATIAYSLNLTNRQTESTDRAETREPTFSAITALGRIEPEGEVIILSPPPNMGGTRIAKLMVREGERVPAGRVIALLDNHELKKAALATAQQEVELARVNLAIVEAGVKQGDIEAQKAVIERLRAELAGKIETQQATEARLKAQLRRESEAQAANLGRSQAELKNASSQFQRYQQLAQDGAISISELDSRRLDLETTRERVREARANYDRIQDTLVEEIKETQATNKETQNTLQRQIQEAQANLASITEVRPLDVQKATAELNRAIANLQEAQQDLNLTYVKAPIASQVLRINARPGEMVTQSKGVVELGQTERMMAIAEIYETDIRQISLGQRATIISEGGVFDDEISGEVTHIRSQIGKKDVFATDPAADVDTRIIEVKITLDPNSSQKVSQFTNSQVIVKINRN